MKEIPHKLIEARISSMIRSWIRESKHTQLELASRIDISRVALNGQLNGRRGRISTTRLCQLVRILKPSESKMASLNALLKITRYLTINSSGDVDAGDLPYTQEDLAEKSPELDLRPISESLARIADALESMVKMNEPLYQYPKLDI